MHATIMSILSRAPVTPEPLWCSCCVHIRSTALKYESHMGQLHPLHNTDCRNTQVMEMLLLHMLSAPPHHMGQRGWSSGSPTQRSVKLLETTRAQPEMS